VWQWASIAARWKINRRKTEDQRREAAEKEAATGSPNVRFGSKADIAECETNVRFTPRRRHRNSVVECPLCAKSGHPPLDHSSASAQGNEPL